MAVSGVWAGRAYRTAGLVGCTQGGGWVGTYGGEMTYYGAPERQCGAKRQHTKQAAKRAAKQTQVTYGGLARKVYRCPFCRYWHVANQRGEHHAQEDQND